ncbi:hypothetical protein FRB93_007637 [Tulasnella sp. JGI-2019a]|nr:hypothetical protein FRB93_007637 [Tulasnella sp. JGI-2019a]
MGQLNQPTVDHIIISGSNRSSFRISPSNCDPTSPQKTLSSTVTNEVCTRAFTLDIPMWSRPTFASQRPAQIEMMLFAPGDRPQAIQAEDQIQENLSDTEMADDAFEREMGIGASLPTSRPK